METQELNIINTINRQLTNQGYAIVQDIIQNQQYQRIAIMRTMISMLKNNNNLDCLCFAIITQGDQMNLTYLSMKKLYSDMKQQLFHIEQFHVIAIFEPRVTIHEVFQHLPNQVRFIQQYPQQLKQKKIKVMKEKNIGPIEQKKLGRIHNKKQPLQQHPNNGNNIQIDNNNEDINEIKLTKKMDIQIPKQQQQQKVDSQQQQMLLILNNKKKQVKQKKKHENIMKKPITQSNTLFGYFKNK